MDEFYCKNKQIANYLVKHGSNLLRIEKSKKFDNILIFVFEKDDTIERNLDQWESNKKKCLF